MQKRYALFLILLLTACTRSPAPAATVPAPEAPPLPTPESTPTATPTRSGLAGIVAAPEFPVGLDWLNVARPLTMTDLRGKIVLLDFWTYGCINCIHVIPELEQLEEKFADELVVIGVHSAKFSNESETENIRQIIQRYDRTHPVINDRDFQVWNQYGATAWPTFVLIDPRGNVLGYHAGEGIYDLFNQVITGMVAQFDATDEIDRTPLALQPERDRLAPSPLLFPGKVLADEENGRLFIADSNHHRIVITDLNGTVLAVAGSGSAGLADGSFARAAFQQPQGLTLADADTLYVADTGNHALRRLDLAAGTVETVAGTGVQGGYTISEGRGTSVSLVSPWDLLAVDGMVYIAMAGRHQLWQYDPQTEIIRVYAGSGREELQDGALLAGGLNQPSGLAADGVRLFVADSEASAVRSAALPGGDGRLQTIVGTGLFDFGDVDGVGDAVRLQHPKGLTFAAGLLYIADTYNHKIRLLDPRTGETSTFLGSGDDGWRDGVDPLFDEPGGVSIAGGQLFIADTNNHVIRVADLAGGETRTLVLVDPDGHLTRRGEEQPYAGKTIFLESQLVSPGENRILLNIQLPPGYKLNNLAPFSVEWSAAAGVTLNSAPFFQETEPTFPLLFTAGVAGDGSLQADIIIYYCEAETESLCLLEQVRLITPVTTDDNGPATITLEHTISLPALP